jgi:hypothetical protein
MQRIRNSFSKQGHISITQLRQLLSDQDERCALTGIQLVPRTASLDHKMPIEHGGENDIENVQIVHALANYAKARLTQSQFVNMCHLVAGLHQNTLDDSWVEMRPRDDETP